MLTLFALIGFFWLFFKGLGLMFRLTWGVTRIVGAVLLGLALPVLGLCVLLSGGVLLMVPLILVGIAVGVLKGHQ